MNLQDMNLSLNDTLGLSPLPTLAENRAQKELDRMERWVETVVESSRAYPRVEIADLTPALAQVLLNRNTSNRKWRESVSARYAADISEGRFRFNGASIVISKTGNLLDGQHRCHGVLIADAPIRAVFVFGVEDEARLTQDQGVARTAGDFLAMEGYQNTNNLAAAMTMYLTFKARGTLMVAGGLRPSKSAIMEAIRVHPGLVSSLEVIPKAKANALGGLSLYAFLHYALTLATNDRAAVTDFLLRLLEGDDLTEGSPILYARNRIITEGHRFRSYERAELIFRAWNFNRLGERPKRIQVVGGKFPEIVR